MDTVQRMKTLNVDAELHRQAKLAAFTRGEPLVELVERALRAELERVELVERALRAELERVDKDQAAA